MFEFVARNYRKIILLIKRTAWRRVRGDGVIGT
jgi:hypothetical protein